MAFFTPATIRLPAVAPLYAITLPRIMARLHIGDTALLSPIYVRTSAGTLADPSTLTVSVLPPSGTPFSLIYGTAPTSGDGDAVIRSAAGTYAVQIELTAAREAGLWRYTVTTTGGRGVETGEFRVLPVEV